MADLAQLEESIVGLSLLDAAELVKKLEARLGKQPGVLSLRSEPPRIGTYLS